MEKPWIEFYPEWVPKSIDYPKVPLFELLKESAEKHPNATAIIFEDAKIPYAKLNELSDKFATALSDLGVGKGDVVAIYLPNTPQFVIAYYGILKTGATVTAVNPLYKERELKYQLENSEAKAIVALDILYPTVKAVKEKTKVENVIVTNIADYISPIKRKLGKLLKKIPVYKVAKKHGVHFFKELLEAYPPKPPKVELNPMNDIAVLQYTGGTTGIPKGAMLTHFNLVSNAVTAAYWLNAEEAKEIHICVLPLFHIYGMTVAMNSPIYKAGAMVMIPKFDVKKVLESIQKYKATVFCGVPTMYAVLINYPEIRKYDLRSINSAFQEQHRFHQKFRRNSWN